MFNLDKKLVIGIIFVSIIVFGAVLLVFRGAIGPLYPSGKTITLTYEGDESVHNVKVSVGNGILIIAKNTSVTGWRFVAKYSENDKPPSFTYNDTHLSVSLGNGILKVYVNSPSFVDFEVGNGKALVVLFGTNATVSGDVRNGDLSAILNRGNYSISLSVVNGAIHLDAYVTELIGSVQVINGDITFIINTNGGGKISYQISNGNSNIFAEGFQTSISETDSGETGNITSPGSNIDLSVTITNGSFTLVITKLSG